MKLAKQILIVFATVFSITSCNFFNRKEPLDRTKLICYWAIDRKDTAWLSIDTSDRKVRGLFTMSYAGVKKFDGEIEGKFNRDTLKAYYDFKVNKVDKWYRNPVVFLLKDEKLIMGVGETILVWGSGHFDEKVPMDFNKGRFIFEKTNCSD